MILLLVYGFRSVRLIEAPLRGDLPEGYPRRP